MSDESNVIFICTDPDAHDADELTEASTLSAGDLVASFHRATEKSLRDSKLFDDFEFKIISPQDGGAAKFLSTKWLFEDGGIGTNANLSEQQEAAFHKADLVGRLAMEAALEASPDLQWYKDLGVDPATVIHP